jgi:pimeloyl-ACP methyl ester carboxylesterase
MHNPTFMGMGLRTRFVTLAIQSALVAGVLAQPSAPAIPQGPVAVPGARLWCLDTGGSGDAVVFLHAGTGSSQVWEHQIPAFTAAGFRIVACDRRGYGRTTIESEAKAAPPPAADDVEQMTQALGLSRFHLVGTAAGGIVALDYALSFSSRLRSLVVANSIGGVQDPDYLEMSRRLRPSPQFEALPVEFRELGPSYRADNPGGVARWLALEHVSRAPGAAAPPQPMKNRITFAALESLAVPTLLITGDADLYTPPAVLRLFAARIKGSALTVLPEAGHSAYWEQPERFNTAVLAFLRHH